MLEGKLATSRTTSKTRRDGTVARFRFMGVAQTHRCRVCHDNLLGFGERGYLVFGSIASSNASASNHRAKTVEWCPSANRWEWFSCVSYYRDLLQ